MTNIQRWVEAQRDIYGSLRKPLLSQLAQLHGITVRDFAAIFNLSKSHAQEVLAHRKDPSLLVAFKIARYFEVTVDDLFGWKYEDGGDRRPLVIETPQGLIRMDAGKKSHGALELVKTVADELRRQERGGS